ncbi:nitrogen fixation protein FixH [Pacificibacter maritimus]|uniref:Nitrogen fixation protein FixH n=1 Tax=Pacificibacter maritimus TaxID=762213 RepID=A0A3N4UGV3_9RHOB|nr:FixH family protein [Pacificibacter maritimus]RPE66471.1 nitrogen fixation protein FixH [Pacificibacter maritimus]
MTREITGKHVLIGTVSAFTVIIAVNLFMAFSAVKTFPGLEVKNSYVASQSFDDDKAAQLALGWTVDALDRNEKLYVTIRDDAGQPVRVKSITGTLGRATNVSQDQTPDFIFDGTSYVAKTGPLDAGNWNYRMQAVAQDGTLFKQRVIIHVKR